MTADMTADTPTPTPTTPTVGMLATYGINADAYAMVITYVSPSGHQVKAKHLNDPDDPTSFSADSRFDRTFTRRANGKYRPVGANYGYLALGHATNYRDPSF